MASLNKTTLTVKGAPAAVLRSEPDRAPLVFVHGGHPGSTPYCSGSHIWGPALDRFAATRGVLAVELPGHGATPAPTLSVDFYAEWMEECLAAAKIQSCFVVGHDLGGLIALQLASRSPSIVKGVSIVSSVAAAPTGDGAENLTLAYPPVPLWSRASQRWAFEQLSYSPHHITDALLDACVAAAQQPSHLKTVAAMREGGFQNEFIPSLMRAKARVYELCRNEGIPIPVQVIWGSHERLGSLDQALWLYRLIAARQTAAHFHLINRVGSFPFREDPQSFHQIVDSFSEVVFPRTP
ncbi:MAG: alpha/beta hydrolase [Xanthobacteraceae bacterium]